jgi:tetratricopeptide (TPR) repeat protein
MKWKCPICNVDRTVDVCPQCGDDLRKWKEMNACAVQLCGEGARYAREGKPVRATLAFAKAVVLNPDEPAALKALGNILAQQGEFEEAIHYLTRCQQRTPADSEVQAALAKIQALLNPMDPPAAPHTASPLEIPVVPPESPAPPTPPEPQPAA